MKYFFSHIPFGRKEVYKKALMEASSEKLTKLIKISGFLLQIKVYMFYRQKRKPKNMRKDEA